MQPEAAGPLGIVAGGGSLPLTIAEAARAAGRPVFIVGLHGTASDAIRAYPHAWVKLGQVGGLFRALRGAGCRDIVFIGALIRPRLTELAFDWTGLRLVPRLVRMMRGGDDHLLSSIARVLGEEGFRVVGAHEIAPEIVAPQGLIAGPAMAADLEADVARGFEIVAALGPFDVGQAVVVHGRRVLAVEAAEGTDLMLARVAELRANGRVRLPARAGVLVKAPKPGQDRRIDLPAIGPRTVERAAAAGIATIAVAAGETIVAEPEALAVAAGRLGVSIIGRRVTPEPAR